MRDEGRFDREHLSFDFIVLSPLAIYPTLASGDARTVKKLLFCKTEMLPVRSMVFMMASSIDISQKACLEQAGCLFHNNYGRCLIKSVSQ